MKKKNEPSVTLTNEVLENLAFHLSDSGDGDHPTPLECAGAWLYSHASGSEKQRDEVLDKLGLKKIPQPNGGYKVRAKAHGEEQKP